MSAPVSAVLLASGLSRRYGSNKLLESVDGLPLYRRAFAALPAPLFHRAAVVSCYDEILRAAEGAGYLPVFNPAPKEGQSLSLRLGLEAVAEDSAAVLFSVCDQPRLTLESVKALLAAHQRRPGRVTALSHRGRRGNPVIFPALYFPELMALTGDTGGAPILRAHPEALQLVEAASLEELEDMDVPPHR